MSSKIFISCIRLAEHAILVSTSISQTIFPLTSTFYRFLVIKKANICYQTALKADATCLYWRDLIFNSLNDVMIAYKL